VECAVRAVSRKAGACATQGMGWDVAHQMRTDVIVEVPDRPALLRNLFKNNAQFLSLFVAIK